MENPFNLKKSDISKGVKKIYRLYYLTIKNIKTMFRDKYHLIWLIGYPLLIIVIFSLAFGFTVNRSNYKIIIFNYDKEDSGIPGNPASYSSILIDVLETNLSGFIEIKGDQNDFTEEKAREELKYERIQAIIYIPCDFTENIYLGKTPQINITTIPDEVVEGVVTSIIREIVNNIIIIHNNATPSKINTAKFQNTIKITNFDTLAPGFIISGILVCISQMSLHFSEEKEQGTLKRLSTTPVPRSFILFSGMFSQLLVAFFQIILLLLFLMLFGAYFHPNVNIFLLISLPMLFAFTSLGFGLLIASLVKSANSAGILSWFVILPLQFLGGLFFYFDNIISKFVPTSYAAHAMRLVMVNGISNWEALGLDIMILIGFGGISTLIGIILFQRKTAVL